MMPATTAGPGYARLQGRHFGPGTLDPLLTKRLPTSPPGSWTLAGPSSNAAGSALVASVVLLLVLAVASALLATLLASSQHSAVQLGSMTQAWLAAEAGLELSLKELREGLDLDGDGEVGTVASRPIGSAGVTTEYDGTDVTAIGTCGSAKRVLRATVSSGFATGSPEVLATYGVKEAGNVMAAEWNGSGWDAVANSSAAGKAPTWVLMHRCPSRDEIAVATVGTDKDVRLQLVKSGAWDAGTQLCSDTDSSDTRPLAMTYENVSGDLLIAFWSKASSRIGYRSYDGATLSPQSNLTVLGNKTVKFIQMASKPGSDEVLMVFVNADKKLFGVIWSGSSWGTIKTLENETTETDVECFSVAYESLLGRALVAWGKKGTTVPKYRLLDGSTWSAELSIPSIGKEARRVCLAADPTSNQLLFASLDGDKDLNFNIWSGSTWGTNQEINTEVVDGNGRKYDLAFEPGGSRALVVYQTGSDGLLRYRNWNGSSLSAQKTGPSYGTEFWGLAALPGASAQDIFVIGHQNDKKVRASRWDGSSFSTPATLNGIDVESDKTQPFMISAATSAGVRLVDWREVVN